MPTVITYRGTKAELVRKLRDFGATLAGKKPDATGAVEGVLQVMGVELLGKIQDAYAVKSEGGTDEMGIKWPELSPVTLALRRQGSGKKVLSRLKSLAKKAGPARKALIAKHYRSLVGVYQSAGRGASITARQKRFAVRLLNLIRPYIAPSRYKKTLALLKKPLPAKRARQQALIGAFALILRDTNRLFNSLSPVINSEGKILRVMPGAAAVGSNLRTKTGLPLLALHNSDKPRKKNRDGRDRLPRRQVLPDAAKPMPPRWLRDIAARGVDSMRQPALWLRYLGPQASFGGR